MKKYYLILILGFGLIFGVNYIYFFTQYNINFWTYLIFAFIGEAITLYAYIKIRFNILHVVKCMMYVILLINFIIVGSTGSSLLSRYIFPDVVQTEYKKWIDFNKNHNCTLKEIDSTKKDTEYLWLCDGEIIYKNHFSEKMLIKIK